MPPSRANEALDDPRQRSKKQMEAETRNFWRGRDPLSAGGAPGRAGAHRVDDAGHQYHGGAVSADERREP